MSEKREFVRLATAPDANIRALCRSFQVSPTTAYELLRRFAKSGDDGLRNLSRKPLSSPFKTEAKLEQLILQIRDETHWGARKITRRIRDLGHHAPHPSTVHSILQRNERVDTAANEEYHTWQRFEHPSPNDLWQMDFKGWFRTGDGICHPLTIVDDHSRFSPCLQACADETSVTVEERLFRVFDRYGLPWRMTMDNGSPWGDDGTRRLTKITALLVRLGIRISHSRPYHPQTQGKDERFHRTLNDELLRWTTFRNLAETQRQFDQWRDRYNLERPHESLEMDPPVRHYQPSTRRLPATLPPIEYESGVAVRRVDTYGYINFRGQKLRVGRGCSGLPVALRPAIEDGVFDVFLCHHRVVQIDLHNNQNQ